MSVGLGDLPPDRVLGERGRGLSSGQRRRVGLARALVRRCPGPAPRRADRGPGRGRRGGRAGRGARRGARRCRRPPRRPPAGSGGGGGPDGGRRVVGVAAAPRPGREPPGVVVSAILAILRIGRPVRGRLAARRPGGCRGGWGGDRARGHVGLADQPRGGAAGDADAAGGDHGRACVRDQPRRVPLPRAAGGPRRRVPGPRRAARDRLRDGSRSWRPPAWQSCAPGTCSRGSWATWTGWRTCGSGSCCRTHRRRSSPSAPSRSWAGWCRRRDSCWP